MAKTSPKNIEQTARRAEALALRRQRLTYQQIGEHMGISGPAAFKLVARALDRYAKVSAENADALREESREDLERLRRALDPALESIDTEARARAVSEAVKIHGRLAALYGLDAAKRQEITGKDGAAIGVSFADLFAAAELAERDAAPAHAHDAPPDDASADGAGEEGDAAEGVQEDGAADDEAPTVSEGD